MELSNTLIHLIIFFFFINTNFPVASPDGDGHSITDTGTSIIFATLGSRSSFSFDIFSLQVPTNTHQLTQSNYELRLTDGNSLNFNGHFPAGNLSLLLPNQADPPPLRLIYVTERNGSSTIYLDAIYYHDTMKTLYPGKRSVLQVSTESTRRIQIPLLSYERSSNSGGRISMKDRPSLAGESLVYVSTQEDPGEPRTSWAAVYSTHLKTGLTRRLTPYGVTDFSPAVSPSGAWTAVASLEGKGWDGEVEELGTDIYVFLTRDGSSRVKVVEHGGWPSWADESTLYFHRRGGDGWWSIYKAILQGNGRINFESVVTQRVTPPGLHSFTPAASQANKGLIAVATRRPGSDYRHIELFDVVSNKFIELTRPVSANSHHFSPFFPPDSFRVGYHRCRGSTNADKSKSLFLKTSKPLRPNSIFFRLMGHFLRSHPTAAGSPT